MASEYSVNISLNTTKAEGKLKNLKKGIDGLTAKKGGAAKKELSAEEQLLKVENQQLIVKNKGLGLTLKALPIEQKGIKIKKAEKLIRAANVAASKEDFDLAKKNLLLADKRIKKAQILVKKNQDINKSTVQSLKGGSTGFTAAQYGPQMASTKGAGQVAMNINTILAQSEKRLGFEIKLRNLEAQGVNTAKLRIKMGDLVDAQNRKEFGSIDRINRKIRTGIKFEESKLRLVQKSNAERAREAKLIANQLQGSALQKQTDIARGKFAGSGPGVFGPQPRPTFAQSMGIKKGFDTQSALISGAFPLLFGQGPVGAIAGGLGGGIGGMFGEMGGFAGGIAATAVVQQIQVALKGVSDLGSALNDTTKDVDAVIAALGITGTEFEKNLKTLEKLGGEEASFEAARQKMINLVGQEGVTALQNFGKGTTELANQFTIAMTQMRASFASFLQGAGAGRFLLNRMTSANLQRQAETSTDPGVVKAKRLVEALEKGFFNRSDEDARIRQANAAGENLTIDQAKKAVEEAQKLANKKADQAAIDKLIGDIQKQRVKNISDEIALLERSFGLSADAFEIEKQIMQMKEDGEIKDESEIRNKLKHLQGLEKERQLAEETAAAFERMSQTIATDMSQGIQGMIRGTSTLNDVLSNVLNKLIDASFNMAFFGNMQGSLGGGGLFGSILGGLGGLFGGGGGSKKTDVFAGMNRGPTDPNTLTMASFANGGRPPVGRPSIVGEKGPELFVPDRAGTIIPNNQLGGGTNIVVNVDASGSSVEGDEEQGRELGRMISVAIQSELIKQKRPGGLLG